MRIAILLLTAASILSAQTKPEETKPEERPVISKVYNPSEQANEFAAAYSEWARFTNARFARCQNACIDAAEAPAFKRMEQAYKRFKSVFEQIYK